MEIAKQKEEESRRKAEEEARIAAEEAKKQEEAAKTAAKAPAGPAGDAKVTAPAVGVSEENKRQSQQYYLSGIIYYDKGDFEKARNEWTHALQLDPGNPDAKAGLERLNNLYGGNAP
ncbi:MAG: hypothetical protein A3J82_08430 [Elusimicrobia bacterium RIFOXYA2_FULL_69_6]|nr:MAG: hypothetical protein A3J82_08430 [Elusimicrobia bacterium RIFOXYA2_FULL_69_6]